jgi:hypothetical protein
LDIAPNQTLTISHNFGGNPDEYSVDLWFRDLDGGLGINHESFGGMEVGGAFIGATWQRLTSTSIEVYRFAQDVNVDQVLLRIWVPDPPVWDSGWLDIAKGTIVTLNHNVGGDPEAYTVGMKCRDSAVDGFGVNLRAAGGMEVAGSFYGAAWQKLTSSSIQVRRFKDDVAADQVRVTIYQPDPPYYDSGWLTATPDQNLVVPHNVGTNPMSYVVRLFTKDIQPDGNGLNSLYGGGFESNSHFFGSAWSKLTNTSITIFRQPNDDEAHSADQVRVWIYATVNKLFLPAVLRNF